MEKRVVLATEKLVKRYGQFTAVKGLSLEVYEGEVFGFLGPNGAGKTTSINMICGLLKPDAGRVFYQGRPVVNGSDEFRARVGVCPQNIVCWERLTVAEQLQLMGQMYGMNGKMAAARARSLMDELDLAEKRSQQARTLSGGMKRRLNIALALVHDPDIVIFDEPEAGLDPQSRVKVRQYIQALARESAGRKAKTVILTTHNMDEAERAAGRVAIIDHGELLVVDTPDALKRRLGEGDVVEIELQSIEEIQWVVKQARECLEGLVGEVGIEEGERKIRVRALDAVGKLPVILERLTNGGLQLGPVHVRANTLEDVFIQLTGRRLRE